MSSLNHFRLIRMYTTALTANSNKISILFLETTTNIQTFILLRYKVGDNVGGGGMGNHLNPI